jgi:ubiquinone/menaquinone biosynthesis C-methylase UbiE
MAGQLFRQLSSSPGSEGAGGQAGLDISAPMLVVGAAMPAPGGASIEWQESEALSFALPTRTFDLVLCQQGLQFFSDRNLALREMRRILASGGRAGGDRVWRQLGRYPLYEALFKATARHLSIPISTMDVSFFVG